jgi:trafficking protein particle complex subunit 10
VNLCDDALVQYDELEATFYQVLREKNLSWYGTLISPGPNDDSSPLLSISKKAYRDLILADTISVFDFRIYLLLRQCELLARMERITEVCTKVGAFLGAFGRRLREVDTPLPKFFIESWIYSSAMSAVEQCDTWASRLTLDGPKLATFNAGKGELLELARNQVCFITRSLFPLIRLQLDVIGIRIGHLPSKPPFSMVHTTTPAEDQMAGEGAISNPDLLAAIENRDTFFELYVTTTNRAIDMYARAGRRKFALKLHGSLAALDVSDSLTPVIF